MKRIELTASPMPIAAMAGEGGQHPGCCRCLYRTSFTIRPPRREEVKSAASRTGEKSLPSRPSRHDEMVATSSNHSVVELPPPVWIDVACAFITAVGIQSCLQQQHLIQPRLPRRVHFICLLPGCHLEMPFASKLITAAW